MKILYLDCFSGISGDMTLAALIDAGLDIKKLRRELKKIAIGGYSLEAGRVKRGGITGTYFRCAACKSRGPHAHRPLKEIFSLIRASSLTDRVKETARDIFTIVGKAEAKIHGFSSLEKVHLHELGDTDSIVDIVGIAVALELMGIDEVYSSPVTMARGRVMSKGGPLPVPAPATLEILRGVPQTILDMDFEFVTPTGAGIIKTLSRGFGAMGPCVVETVGYGAGSRDAGYMPNMLRAIIGTTIRSPRSEKIVVVETTIDDMNPQFFEHVFDRLFNAGAVDVFVTNVLMKKGRPGFVLSVLCKHTSLDDVSSVLLKETTAIGVRFYEAERHILERKKIRVKTPFGAISVKVSTGDRGEITYSPEYDECRRAALIHKVPLKTVHAASRALVTGTGFFPG